jgi:acetyl-CoA carboxylase beta subunit
MNVRNLPNDTKIKCTKCESTFFRKDLKKDYQPICDGEIWTECVCPKCGHWLGTRFELDEKFLIVEAI